MFGGVRFVIDLYDFIEFVDFFKLDFVIVCVVNFWLFFWFVLVIGIE